MLRENVLGTGEIAALKTQLAECIERESVARGPEASRDYAMLLAAPIYGGAILELADNRELFIPVNEVLGETCIIHVYTSSSLPPHARNYSARVHRERNDKYPDILDFVALIILLDDFTEANGATWFLPGSHRSKSPPSEDYFYKHALRLIAPAGSVFYFDWRLVHAGGENTTASWRHALAMGITPAYYKQKIDLPRAIPAAAAASLGDRAKQKLGFFSVPPVSLDEYYAPEHLRPYRQKPI